MKYSIIVPVFNRPDEVDELLESLCSQTLKDFELHSNSVTTRQSTDKSDSALAAPSFEVVIVEDGSKKPCKDVCDKYAGILDLHYYYKDNSGPGQSRNYGVERAHGDYVIILDSDVVVPEGYLENINSQLSSFNSQLVAFGGPDAAHPSFTPVQKAISYSMTSFFTTGGIRGGKKKLDKFYPRSFNMGIRRDVYLQLGGFSKMRFGEDIDFSYRIVEAGYQPQLLPDAWVWHKRRTDFRKFFRQVYNSGIARINLEKRHPGTMKLVHLLPTVFTLGTIGCLALTAWHWWFILPILFYAIIICIDSTLQNKSLKVGLLSIPAAFVQLIGYGLGFIESWWKRCVLKQDEFTAFEKNFYK